MLGVLEEEAKTAGWGPARDEKNLLVEELAVREVRTNLALSIYDAQLVRAGGDVFGER